MIVWQDYFCVACVLAVLYTAWREAHPYPPEPPDYLSSFRYFAYRND